MKQRKDRIKEKKKRENPFLILCICLSFMLIHCKLLTRIYIPPPLRVESGVFRTKTVSQWNDFALILDDVYLSHKIMIMVIHVYVQIYKFYYICERLLSEIEC